MRKYKLKSYERLSLFEQVVFILSVLLCFLLWIPASISLHFPHVPLNEDRNLILFEPYIPLRKESKYSEGNLKFFVAKMKYNRYIYMFKWQIRN